MKIDTCIIIKNEEKTIEKLISQFLLFSNEVHITDTGSTDNTINIIKSFQNDHKNVFLHNFEWCMDFAKARNYSLTCYECNADYQFWCDGDDELNDILISTLQDFIKSDNNDADIYFMKYLYAPPSDYTHWRTSLLKVSAKFKWNDPIHEYIGYTYNHKVNYELFNNGSLIIHHKSNLKEHGDRNLKIFMKMEHDNYPFTCRNRYYYGRELYYNKLYDCAAYQFFKCIDDHSNNTLDKINAVIKLLDINNDNAPEYFFKVFNNRIYRKDMFYYMGKYYFNKKYFDLAKYYYILCINSKEPKNNQSFGYDTLCHINSLLQLGVIEYKENDIEKSKMYNEKILEIDKTNKTALKNISLLEQYLLKNENNKNQ